MVALEPRDGLERSTVRYGGLDFYSMKREAKVFLRFSGFPMPSES